MSTVIRNADNKVIRNVTGNILKQNFQFGKAFNGSGIRIYKPTNFQVGISTLSIIQFERDLGGIAATDGQFSFKNASFANVFGAGYNSNDTRLIHTVNDTNFLPANSLIGDLTPGTNAVSYINTITKTISTIRKWLFEFNAANYNIYRNSALSMANTTMTQVNDTVIDYFEFGRGPSRGNSVTPSTPKNSGSKIGAMFMFNRVLSQAEINYLYNNGLGNTPASREGLIGEWMIDFAEECDFSALQNGSDIRIAFRDTSGNNNHAEIMDIPAGTNAEKITYVNTNWLLTW